MAIITLKQYGKPFVAFDESKISFVTCFDVQDQKIDPIPNHEFSLIIQMVCGGGTVEIGFTSSDRLAWAACYAALLASMYVAAGQPMTAGVPLPVK